MGDRLPLTCTGGFKFFFVKFEIVKPFLWWLSRFKTQEFLRGYQDFQIILAISVAPAQVAVSREGMSSPVHRRPHYSLLADSRSFPWGTMPICVGIWDCNHTFRAMMSRILRYSSLKTSCYLVSTTLSQMGHIPLWSMAKEYCRCNQGP